MIEWAASLRRRTSIRHGPSRTSIRHRHDQPTGTTRRTAVQEASGRGFGSNGRLMGWVRANRRLGVQEVERSGRRQRPRMDGRGCHTRGLTWTMTSTRHHRVDGVSGDSSQILGGGAAILHVVIVDVDVILDAKALRLTATFDVEPIVALGRGPILRCKTRQSARRRGSRSTRGSDVYVPLRCRHTQRCGQGRRPRQRLPSTST
jgi:hypothetical protein